MILLNDELHIIFKGRNLESSNHSSFFLIINEIVFYIICSEIYKLAKLLLLNKPVEQ